jgi:hypothetical protein
MDKKLAEGNHINELDSACYISWSNCLVRTMSRLGFEPKKSNGSSKASLAILAELDDAPA